MRRNSSCVAIRCTPRENDPSGIFTTSGRPSSSIARGRSARSASNTVCGIGTWLEPSSSIRNTLLVQRIIEIGSSMTGMPSCQARRAKR